MITCYLRYEVPLGKLADFEAYGAMWLDLVPRFGGVHHGYFLQSEGESDIALAMFSFPSLAAYEQYRKDSDTDPDAHFASSFSPNRISCAVSAPSPAIREAPAMAAAACGGP